MTAVVVAAGVVAVPTTVAVADTDPADPTDPTTPRTVSVDPLPTAQINGVVWAQVVVGNTVYVGGEFTRARPAGSPSGSNEVVRNNLLAYDIRTGVLLNTWAPSVNGAVDAIVASPDGSRIYAGGNFTTVNGVTHRRIVALDPATGNRIAAFNPNPDARVRAIGATNQTVYLGGSFGSVGGQTRSRLAAARASDGAVLSWAPVANEKVSAIEVSPDGRQVLVGGEFTSINGSTNPGWGMGSLDPVTGALLPWAANSLVRNGNYNGDTGAINYFSSDGEHVYATGFTYGRSGGTLEGIAKMSWDGGALVWVQDCHGDTYGSFPLDDVVYSVGHAHYCGNVPGGFGQMNPWKFYRGIAFSKETTGVLRRDIYGYTNWAGTPSPSIAHWFPEFQSGSYTGQTQAAWAVTGNDDYVVAGGEFPRVEGVAQQGLVRFARSSIAPDDTGPEVRGANTNPTLRSPGSGQVLVSWRSNWDRDSRDLTYSVIRNGDTANPVHVRTVSTTDWGRPYQSFLDTGLTPGSTASYRIFTRDPLGNETRSDTVSVQVAGSGSADAYARAVTEDGPMHYWRFSEGSGTAVAGYTGLESLTTTSGPTRGVAGAIGGDPAIRFNGTGSQTSANQTGVHGEFWYSVEAWFNTTSTRGGKIVGFGDARTGNSSTNGQDRHLYLDGSGRVNFGSRVGGSGKRVLTSGGGLDNGQWHHAVGVVADTGMSLYVDGVRVGFRTDTTTGGSYVGYWRVGGDNLSGWANRPASDYFDGAVDEVAVYAHPLTGNDVRAHYLASGRSLSGVPADAYGKAVYGSGPDAYWRLAETSGTTATDSSRTGTTGSYLNGTTQGGPSAVGVSGDRSASFDGVNDNVATNSSVPGPPEYSEEAWFRTSTGSGGKLLGFGSSRTGSSGTTDRNVFMTNGGRIRFATSFQGAQTALESAQSYNDGSWHHVVATQGTSGMRLYVDGVQVASGPLSTATANTGYWRVGGDSLSGWASRPSSDWFDGDLDEVAFYSRALRSSEVVDHYARGGGVAANAPPVAAFSWSASNLSVTFDNESTDPDGSITASSWSFGDGGTSSAANPTHVYPAAGTYQVTLTVTDDEGATGSVSHPVTVTAPGNQPPVASFTVAEDLLTIDVDGSGSSDPDGSLVAHTWGWGDGTPDGSGPTASHSFAAPGTYTVTLTVTDDDGAVGTDARLVTVSDTQGPVAADAFGRTVGTGWGSADVGGGWTNTGTSSRWSVGAGVGRFTMPSAGVGAWNRLAAVSATDVDGTVDLSVDKPVTGGGLYLSTAARRTGNSEYRYNVRIAADGSVRLSVSRVVDGAETTLGAAQTVAGLGFQQGDVLRLRFRAAGSGTTTLSTSIWEVGQPEPATPQVTRTDSTGALQGPGAVGVYAYLSGSATNAPVTASFDNLDVR